MLQCIASKQPLQIHYAHYPAAGAILQCLVPACEATIPFPYKSENRPQNFAADTPFEKQLSAQQKRNQAPVCVQAFSET